MDHLRVRKRSLVAHGTTKVLLDTMIENAEEGMTMFCVTLEMDFGPAGDRQFRAKVWKVRDSVIGCLTSPRSHRMAAFVAALRRDPWFGQSDHFAA